MPQGGLAVLRPADAEASGAEARVRTQLPALLLPFIANERQVARQAAYTNLLSGKVRHNIRDEKFTGLYVVPLIAIDQQLDAGVLVIPDQVDGFGHGAEKATQ